ncbi:long-chain fatty acid--CoA ligase [Nostocoides sp. F2B08]|uniref:AMP-dependent synthetase/ligase n=1 Tax=Nostocoides sp. F2B08 TaxID=2653936 RepID=UPI001D055A95|nr:AMP-binding protein [Tetrasphaera sp. F2B08]
MTATTTPTSSAATTHATWHLSRQLRENAAQMPQRVALREKRHGIWRDITWADYLANVEMVAYALAALGVGPTDRVAIQSENRPEWLYVDLGSNMLRAAVVGFYPTNPVAEIRYLLQDSGARVLVAEDQEQVDKAMAVIDDVDTLEWVVYLDSRGLADYDDPRLLSLDEAVARGAERRASDPELLSRIDAEKTPEDLVTLIYTSGTTGPPRGAMLSADNISYGTDVFAEDDGMFGSDGLTHDDVLVSYLPLSHVVERGVTTWGGLRNGTIVHFAESIDTVVADLAEVQPTVLFAVPRIWEKIQASVAIRMANASRVKRLAYDLSRRLGDRAAQERIGTGGAHTPLSRVLTFCAWVLAGRKLRRHLGLAKVRMALSGAAPISTEVLTFFLSIGVLIHEAYGMTENTAVATANRPGRVRLGTVGEPQPGIDLRLDDRTGEILTRHRGTFIGYWNKPEATAETVDADGWLHTGDVGEWVEGTHLKIVDRIKDIIITAGGKNISPSEIENAIKASPYVREAVVIGDQRPYLTAIIGIEFDTVADWASRRRIEYTTYRDLSTKPEVIELIADVVRDVNTRLARVESVRKLRMLHKELDHEDGELTATQKLKRSAFAATVPHLIDDMYAGTSEYPGADLGRG